MTGKPYAILRVQRLKTIADLDGATRHGRREDNGVHYDPERTPYNRHWAAGPVSGPVDWAQGLEDAVKRLGATVRQSAPVAAEFFIGASPEFFMAADGDNMDLEKIYHWADFNMAVFYRRFGKSVVTARLDLDEATPHMTICVVPTYRKVTKHGSSTVVSYRKVFGGENKQQARDRLTEWQDWYAQQMEPLGLHRGISKLETGRRHLTHQAYARERRRDEDKLRHALQQAESRNEALAAQLAAAKERLQDIARLEAMAMANTRQATEKLIKVEKLRVFADNFAAALLSLDKTGEAAAFVGMKQESIDLWRAHIESLSAQTETTNPNDDDPAPLRF
jgi:hypothetical protein